MTVSAMDTAKLPRSHTEGPADPVEIVAEGEVADASEAQQVAVAGRRALREERRHLRRQQRRYAIAGITVLAAMFLLAIILLGGIR